VSSNIQRIPLPELGQMSHRYPDCLLTELLSVILVELDCRIDVRHNTAGPRATGLHVEINSACASWYTVRRNDSLASSVAPVCAISVSRSGW
jgi:hypothetical protein